MFEKLYYFRLDSNIDTKKHFDYVISANLIEKIVFLVGFTNISLQRAATGRPALRTPRGQGRRFQANLHIITHVVPTYNLNLYNFIIY